MRRAKRAAACAVIALAAAVTVATFAPTAAADLVPPNGQPRGPRVRPGPPSPATASAAPPAPTAAPTTSAAAPPAPATSAAAPLAPTAAPTTSAAAAPTGSAGPQGSAGPASSAAPGPDDVCDDGVTAWTKTASQRTGLAITAVSCVAGVVRLKVADAGCDFEVTRAKAFKRTTSGAIGVSPIVNLEWETAPEPMKKALDGILAALEQDPSLDIRKGDPVHGGGSKADAGSNRTQIAAGVAGALALAAVGAALAKRRGASPTTPTPPAP